MQKLVDLGAEGYVTFDQADFRGSVSKYKNCSMNYGNSMPFQDFDYISSIHDKLTTDTDRALYLMSKLIKDHFVIEKRDKSSPIRKTARKILYVVNEDVPGDVILYCDKHCKPIKKKDLVRSDNIELQSFLLGVWEYIIRECHDNKSSQYKKTLDLIYREKETANSIGVYDDSFAKGVFTNITFDMPSYSEVDSQIVNSSFAKDVETDECVIRIEGEVVDKEDFIDEPGKSKGSPSDNMPKYGSFTNNGIYIDNFNGNITYKGN